MAMPRLDSGVLAQENEAKRTELIDLLKKAYWMGIFAGVRALTTRRRTVS